MSESFVTPAVEENGPCDPCPGPNENPRYQHICRKCGRLLPDSTTNQEETP